MHLGESGIQKHSAGPQFPYVIGVRRGGPLLGKHSTEVFVLRPGVGEVYSCIGSFEVAHAMAEEWCRNNPAI